jgi:beta-mannanase
MDMQAFFTGWGSSGSFPSGYGSTVRDQGKTLFLYWEQYGTTLDGIINGSQDAYIKQFAAAAKAYGGPVILAPFHEMNGDWTPWSGAVSGNSPAKVVTAWQHIHDLFAGANNVKFAWVMNGNSVPDTAANAISKYWPGSAYVDYIGLDNFNGPSYSSSLTFDALFADAIAEVKGFNKPIIITSTACAQNANKPAWITTSLTTAIKKYPSVIGWIWFNEDKEADWRVNSDAASLTAFKNAIPS